MPPRRRAPPSPVAAESSSVAGDASDNSLLGTASTFVYRHSSTLHFLMALMGASFFGWRISINADELAGITQHPILTARFSYAPQDVYTFLHQLGDQGINLYLNINMLELGFAVSAAVGLSFLIGNIYDKGGLSHQWNLFPAIFLVFDLAETAVIRWLLFTYPTPNLKLAWAASELTRYKFRFLLYTSGVILFGLIAWGRKTYFPSRPAVSAPDHLE
ncbi:hypothetical protein WJX73_007464 [Symbiochloris irregularis]|uniref:Uncharacterized protein n=1 Tax=Symbiochloris irregularis TaxID=706552 RepID=A0AAW1P8N8_9CHLO